MKTRIALLLGAAIAVSPVSVLAQTDASPAPVVVDMALVTELCGAVAENENELEACTAKVEATLARLPEASLEDSSTLQERAQALADDTGALIDDALDQVRDVDVRAALDDALAGVDGTNLEGALDDALVGLDDLGLSMDIDMGAVVDDAVAEAMNTVGDLDLGAAIEDALAEANVAIEDAQIQERLDEALEGLDEQLEDARVIVAAAQTWVEENPEAVCLGSSIGLGATVGLAVVATTSIEFLGFQAFRSTERFTNDFCADFLG